MPYGLKRYQQSGQLHFVTFSCYHRLPYLATPEAKTVVEQVLEHTRETHIFDLHAYVLMPEHVHLLPEPLRHDLATTVKVLKQESAKLLPSRREHLWQTRYYDHNVRSDANRLEKIRYIHRNPVKRSLVTCPEDYPWSSALHYATGTITYLPLTSYWTTHISSPPRQRPVLQRPTGRPLLNSSQNRVPHTSILRCGPSRKARSLPDPFHRPKLREATAKPKMFLPA